MAKNKESRDNAETETATCLTGNPFARALAGRDLDAMSSEALATLALAYEQHQRNRLAAITAAYRNLRLPEELKALAKG